jgi:hypothetical protein
MFLFRLAAHLGLTVQQIEETMTSAEFSEWQAFDLYHQPLNDGWRQAAMVAATTAAPHTPKGRTLNPDDFVPVAKLPQTQEEMMQQLEKLKSRTGAAQ